MAGERSPSQGFDERDEGCSAEIRDVGRRGAAEDFAGVGGDGDDVFDTDAEFPADIDAPIIGRQAWEVVR